MSNSISYSDSTDYVWANNYVTTTSTTAVISGVYPINAIAGTIDIPQKKRLFKCEYCDTYTEEPGKCKNCGAPLKLVE